MPSSTDSVCLLRKLVLILTLPFFGLLLSGCADDGDDDGEESGVAEILSVPRVSALSVVQGGQLTVEVDVDADTEYVAVELISDDPSDPYHGNEVTNPLVDGWYELLTPPLEQQTVTLTLDILDDVDAPPGTYVLTVLVYENATGFDGSLYLPDVTGTTYEDTYTRFKLDGTTVLGQTATSLPVVTIEMTAAP